MHHRGSRLHAVVAALLLALGAVCTVAGVASLTSSTSDPSAVTSSRSRSHDGTDARREALSPRAPATAAAKSGRHASGPRVDLLGVAATVAAGALLLLVGFVAARARRLLPRLVTAPLGARAPPALA